MGLRVFLSLAYTKLRGPAQLGKTSLPSFMASASVLAFCFVLFFLFIGSFLFSVMLEWLLVCLALRCSDCLMDIKLSAWFLSIANSLGQ